MATRNAEKFAYRYAPFINLLMILLTPLTFIINRFSNLLMPQTANGHEHEGAITEQELRTVVDVSNEEGVLESDERTMINNVVDFGDFEARNVMVPAIRMKCVADDISYDELISEFASEQYSRMPVYSGSKDNIIGIVFAKDLLVKYKPGKPFKIQDYLREAFFTYESKNTRELMSEMRANYKTMAIVLDEYGATSGMITLEDLLEEIVGEIRDEYDTDETDDVTVLDEDRFNVSGMMTLGDFNDRFETEISSEDYDSIAGHVVNLLNHFPEVGDTVTDETAGIRFTVLELDKKRIALLKIEKLEKCEA